jgi:hypothetical protein
MSTRQEGPDWTDFNVHDPGVTLLEALVYDLRDSAARLGQLVRASRCGWRCALLIAAGLGTAFAWSTVRRSSGAASHRR